MNTIRWLVLASAGAFACGGETVEFRETLTAPLAIRGFSTPESILHDTASDTYLVSNINGAPTATDDNGFISRVSPAGEVLELRWIDGAAPDVTLNAPKGMAIFGGRLYVADITVVRVFDAVTGAQTGTVVVEGSTFLNDLAAAPNGTIYLSDSGLDAAFQPTGTDAVYRLEGNVFTKIISGADLGHPNGLLATGGGLVQVVTFGSGELFGVGPMGRMDSATLPTGSLDGIVAYPGGVYVSSWEGSSILAGTLERGFEVVVSDVPAPADIEYDATRNRLLIPLFQADEIRIVPLGR